MLHVRDDHVATMEFCLVWNSGDAEHRERLHAPRVNFWRDMLPCRLRTALEGLGEGDTARVHLPTGMAAPLPDKPLRLPFRAFAGLSVAGRPLVPRTGRFYPRGRVADVPGVFSRSDLRPLRVLGRNDTHFHAAISHPLAGREASLLATVLALRAKPGDVGGALHCWLEELANDGPGMQADLPDATTDFGGDDAMVRENEHPDTTFYTEPRMVDHLDDEALSALRGMLAARLRPEWRVLDLMASHDSHLQETARLHVTGLGLNVEELERNPALSLRVMQDLNRNPLLPFAPGIFNAVCINLSVEYLTNPVTVLAEAARVLAPGGRLLISFSNRYFPTKAVRVWTELHDFERMGYVLGLLRATGRFGGLATESLRNRLRPVTDKYWPALRVSDPVYLVEAVRRE